MNAIVDAVGFLVRQKK